MLASAPGTFVPSIFSFESKQLRIIVIDGEPWFVAADVCAILDLGNPTKAVSALDDDEKTLTSIQGIHTGTGNPNVNIINESGLYTLILRCRDAVKPGSIPHRFRKKVTAEILPAIRKTGKYEAEPSGMTREQLKDAFRSRRWLTDSSDGSDIHFHPVHPDAFLITPAQLAEVLREPGCVSLHLLPDILRACAQRFEYAQIVKDREAHA